MNAILDEMLAHYTRPAEMRLSDATPATSATSATFEHPCGFAGDSDACDSLRLLRHGCDTAATVANVADSRRPENTPQSQYPCGLSQKSQESQGVPGGKGKSATRWTDGDIARFMNRRARLIRWGWPEQDAEALAERLVRRDQESDDRSLCLECSNFRPGRCGNHRRAGLLTSDAGRDFATMLQRCDGFEPG